MGKNLFFFHGEEEVNYDCQAGQDLNIYQEEKYLNNPSRVERIDSAEMHGVAPEDTETPTEAGSEFSQHWKSFVALA